MSDDTTTTITGEGDHGHDYPPTDEVIDDLDIDDDEVEEEAGRKLARDLPDNTGDIPPNDLAPVLEETAQQYNTRFQQHDERFRSEVQQYEQARTQLDELQYSRNYLADRVHDDDVIIHRDFVGFSAEIPADDPDDPATGEREELLDHHNDRIRDLKDHLDERLDRIREAARHREVYRAALKRVQSYNAATNDILDASGGGASHGAREGAQNRSHQQTQPSGTPIDETGDAPGDEDALVADLRTGEPEGDDGAGKGRNLGPSRSPDDR